MKMLDLHGNKLVNMLFLINKIIHNKIQDYYLKVYLISTNIQNKNNLKF